MSMNRENVTWQSEDGLWNLGMYTVLDGNIFDEDYDPEWDVDYDFSSFWWVSTGHRTEEAAFDSWHGSNPGGSTVVAHSPESAEDCARFDQMAAACRKEARAARAARAERPVVRW